MAFQTLVALAILVETITGVVKSLLTGAGLVLLDWADQLISFGVAVALSFWGNVDFFALLSQFFPISFRVPPAFGILLTALIVARGSNAVHDVMKRLNPGSQSSTRIW